MKKFLLSVSLLVMSSSSLAETVLISCSGATTGGSVYDSVQLVQEGTTLKLKSKFVNEPSELEEEILADESDSVSRSFLIVDEKEYKRYFVASPVANQGVILTMIKFEKDWQAAVEFFKTCSGNF